MSESGNSVIAESTLALIRADLDEMKSALSADGRAKVEAFEWTVRTERGVDTREYMALVDSALRGTVSSSKEWVWIGLTLGPLGACFYGYEGRTEPTPEEFTNGAPERLRAQCASVAEYAINRVVTR